MGGFSPWHIFVVLIVALVLFFGWKQLPDMARSLGRSLRVFKTEIKGMSEDDDARKKADDSRAETARAETVRAETVRTQTARTEPAAIEAPAVEATRPQATPRPRPTPSPNGQRPTAERSAGNTR